MWRTYCFSDRLNILEEHLRGNSRFVALVVQVNLPIHAASPSSNEHSKCPAHHEAAVWFDSPRTSRPADAAHSKTDPRVAVQILRPVRRVPPGLDNHECVDDRVVEGDSDCVERETQRDRVLAAYRQQGQQEQTLQHAVYTHVQTTL